MAQKKERICNCGLKESEHNVRHPFVPQDESDKILKNLDKQLAELKRQKYLIIDTYFIKAKLCLLAGDENEYDRLIRKAAYLKERTDCL